MNLIRIKAALKPAFLSALEDHDAFFVARFKGDLAARAIESNHDKMTALIASLNLYAKPVLCDLGGVTGADTATLAVLVQRLVDFCKHGKQKIVFFNVGEKILGLLEIAHLAPFFEIRGTQEEAQAALANFKCKIGEIK